MARHKSHAPSIPADAELPAKIERQLVEAKPQINADEGEIAALVRQLPGWEDGVGITTFLYSLLQRKYGLSLADLAGLTPYRKKMYLEDLIREAGATPLVPTHSEATPLVPTHSEDFTSVNWFGTQYQFTKGLQAQAVRVLWEAWKNKTPTLSEKTIGDMIGSSGDNFQLVKVFRKKNPSGYTPHPAWGTMIRRAGKGTYQLVQPNETNEDQES